MKPIVVTQGISVFIYAVVFLAVRSYYGERRYGSAARYQTFWPRLLANWCDALVLWPVMLLNLVIPNVGAPPVLAAFVMVLTSVAGWTYVVWLHARFGATVGKMNCRVRIVDARTEEPIGWRQAILRELCPILAGLGAVGWLIVMVASGKFHLNGSPEEGRAMIHSNGFWLLNIIPTIWLAAEVLTMLTNKKRRALHDWIAGTVVVRTLAEAEPAPAS